MRCRRHPLRVPPAQGSYRQRGRRSKKFRCLRQGAAADWRTGILVGSAIGVRTFPPLRGAWCHAGPAAVMTRPQSRAWAGTRCVARCFVLARCGLSLVVGSTGLTWGAPVPRDALRACATLRRRVRGQNYTGGQGAWRRSARHAQSQAPAAPGSDPRRALREGEQGVRRR